MTGFVFAYKQKKKKIRLHFDFFNPVPACPLLLFFISPSNSDETTYEYDRLFGQLHLKVYHLLINEPQWSSRRKFIQGIIEKFKFYGDQ